MARSTPSVAIKSSPSRSGNVSPTNPNDADRALTLASSSFALRQTTTSACGKTDLAQHATIVALDRSHLATTIRALPVISPSSDPSHVDDGSGTMENGAWEAGRRMGNDVMVPPALHCRQPAIYRNSGRF
ncbi:MAG: hypothetical protein ABIR80_09180 [Opitutaceae bacterium]